MSLKRDILLVSIMPIIIIIIFGIALAGHIVIVEPIFDKNYNIYKKELDSTNTCGTLIVFSTTIQKESISQWMYDNLTNQIKLKMEKLNC